MDLGAKNNVYRFNPGKAIPIFLPLHLMFINKLLCGAQSHLIPPCVSLHLPRQRHQQLPQFPLLKGQKIAISGYLENLMMS